MTITPHLDTIRAALIEARHAKRTAALYTDAEWAARQARIEAALVALQEAPQPDWSQAPAWAMWRVCNASGDVWWLDKEPHVTGAHWCRWDKGEHRAQYASTIVIPIGIDWRTLKQQRPQKGDAEWAARQARIEAALDALQDGAEPVVPDDVDKFLRRLLAWEIDRAESGAYRPKDAIEIARLSKASLAWLDSLKGGGDAT